MKNKNYTLRTFIILLITFFLGALGQAQCTHTFTGYDSYGDGWNGASATIEVNGAPAALCSVPTGSSESVTFDAKDGDLITLSWMSGSWDSEISWDVKDGGGNTISMGIFGTSVVGPGACPAPIQCATLDYLQDFESGTTSMASTTGSQASVALNATAANASAYGLHMEGNTSSYWYTPYTTGPDAFNSSPNHIASVSREICASTDPTLTLTFNKMQTYTYNVNYCWFRLTVDGVVVSDVNGNSYFNGSNNTWETMTYDLSAYAGMDFTVAWESCAKYYDGYTSTGMGGDNVFIDDILIIQTSGLAPPTTPGAISGNDYPNSGATTAFSISPINNADSYNWTIPSGWTLMSGQGTSSILVRTTDLDGNISVTSVNLAGSSSPRTLAVKTADKITSYPYATAFENETTDGTAASTTGFTFSENGWRNVDGDDGDWRTDMGGTGSSGTGPGASSSGQLDRNPGTTSGKYLYVEASSPMYPSKVFYLWSPPYDLTSLNIPTLTFWYNMQGTTGASLALQKSTDNGDTWSSDIAFMCPTVSSTAAVADNMGAGWRQGFIDLSSCNNLSNVMFRFKATTGTSWDSDICLDDIKLVDAQNTGVDVGESISLDANSYSMAYGLVLNGSSAQTITSNGYNISNIEVDNPSGVTLSGELKIDGILTLTNGVITTGSDRITTTAAPSGSIVGGSSSAFINGNLRRYVATSGTYTFPVGDGTATSDYHRIDLMNSNLQGITYIDAMVGTMSTAGSGQLQTEQLGSDILEMFNKEWFLTPNTQPTGGSYGVNLFLNGLGNALLVDNGFTVLKRPSNSTTYADWDTHEMTTAIPLEDLPGRTIAGGYAQKTGFTSFSGFGVGGTGGGALPIDLVSFGATPIDDHVQVNWTVACQVNNDFFTIQRSIDTENWVDVGVIQGEGTNNEMMEYILIDDEPFDGTSYYRLSQTDYDGTTEVFNPVVVNIVLPIVFSINPNPVTDVLFLYLEDQIDGRTDIVIYNTRGKQVYKKSFIGEFTTLKLRVKDLNRGYYVLTVTQDKKSGTLKFIKE